MSRVTIVSRGHALFGQTLEVVAVRSARGPAFLVVRLPDGRKRNVPRSITELAIEPFGSDKDSVEGSLWVSVRTLTPLARYLAARSAAADVIAYGDPSRPAEQGDVASKAEQSRPAASLATASGYEQGPDRIDPRRNDPAPKANPRVGRST